MPGPNFGKLGGKAGLGLALVGLLAIAFGWNGAAGQTSTLAQMPYILSGGLIGIALVILARRCSSCRATARTARCSRPS
jgi:hypothetical protein